MSTGLLLTVGGMAFSFAQPVERMSHVLPLHSVFHPAIFISILGQLVVHLTAMVYCAWLAKSEMGEAAANAIIASKAKFSPNLLNTVVFVVQTTQQDSVLLVNYKGRPWMTGATENQARRVGTRARSLARSLARSQRTLAAGPAVLARYHDGRSHPVRYGSVPRGQPVPGAPEAGSRPLLTRAA